MVPKNPMSNYRLKKVQDECYFVNSLLLYYAMIIHSTVSMSVMPQITTSVHIHYDF